MISGILAGGIPGFRIELCCFLHPLKWPIVILWLVLLLLFISMGLRQHGTQVVFACAEMILSYHLLPQLIFFTHKLVTVTSLLGGLCWCLLFVCVGFCFWCFVVLFPVLCFLFSDERDRA